METDQKLGAEIGNVEPKSLEAKPVKVTGVTIEEVPKYGDKVSFNVKHPDKDDNLQISRVTYIYNKEVKSSGTWLKFDENNQIQKGTAIATTMEKFSCKKLNDFIGRELPTEMEGGYLAIKAY